MSEIQFPRRHITDPMSNLDREIYKKLGDLHIYLAKDGEVSFDTFVDDPKRRGVIRRVAMNIGWPVPHSAADTVTIDEKYLTLAVLNKIFQRQFNRESMEVITKPAPLILGVGSEEKKTEFIGKEGDGDGQGADGRDGDLAVEGTGPTGSSVPAGDTNKPG